MVKSKRVTLWQKHKVLRKVKEHHRKKREEGRAGQWKKVDKDPGIPNEWPFKEQELKALENRRAQAFQELELKKEARKERARKRKLRLLEDADIANLASAASVQDSEFAAKDNAPLAVAKTNDHSQRYFYKELVKVIEASDVILEVQWPLLATELQDSSASFAAAPRFRWGKDVWTGGTISTFG